MKREELNALGLSEEQVKSVLALNGRDIEKYKSQNEELKAQAQQTIDAAAQQIASLQLNYAVNSALQKAGARNQEAVKALLNMKEIHYEDGVLSGLEEQLDKLQEAPESAFLFVGQALPQFSRPTGMGIPSVTKEDFAKMGYLERLSLREQNETLYNQLKE